MRRKEEEEEEGGVGERTEMSQRRRGTGRKIGRKRKGE